MGDSFEGERFPAPIVAGVGGVSIGEVNWACSYFLETKSDFARD
jgi:hypothetical protein